MFRRGRRCLAITLAVAALALPAAPAAAAGRSEAGAAWTVGMELWARLGQIGDWLRTTFLSDGTGFIDPNGGTSHIDPNWLQGSTSDYTSFIDPNG
jgi:hypothetical protein